MKIKYKILWIEDNLKEIEGLIKNLEYRLEELGFILEVDKRVTLTGSVLRDLSQKLSTYNPYDIIIFDYDLGTTKGDDIAHKLRTAIYTDMIFYSGTKGSELRRILFDKNIEGVYTVNRPNFIDDAWPIIEDQIKRISDVNNMRGVILDEMSKIDLDMRGLLDSKYNELRDDIKSEQLDKFRESLDKRIKSLQKMLKKINIQNFSEIFNKPTKIEFNQVRNRLKSITENDIFGETGALKTKQNLRNKFAHNKAIYNKENGTVSLSGFDEEYGFEKFSEIRKELIKLSEDINTIK